jgi:hypothetical protein
MIGMDMDAASMDGWYDSTIQPMEVKRAQIPSDGRYALVEKSGWLNKGNWPPSNERNPSAFGVQSCCLLLATAVVAVACLAASSLARSY